VLFCVVVADAFLMVPTKNAHSRSTTPVSVSVLEQRPSPTTTTTTTTTTALSNIPRRVVLGGVLGSAALMGSGGAGLSRKSHASAATTATNKQQQKLLQLPLADLPMIRLQLPPDGLGRNYAAIKLMIDGKGPFTFMVDSGLTLEMITPHLQQTLGLASSSKYKIQGLGAGGSTGVNSIIELKGASLCCGDFYSTTTGGKEKKETLPLPRPLHAIITNFPQEHIDPAHDPVEGMLGMEFLEMFDVDLDFPRGRLRLYPPGTFLPPPNAKWAGAQKELGLVEIPAVVINETGLLGIRVTKKGSTQPILGFLDCGAPFSCLNWKAAEILKLPPKTDKKYSKGPQLAAVGVDGRPLFLPTLPRQQLDFCGDMQVDQTTGRPTGYFAPSPSEFQQWGPITLAIGDLPAFSTVLGDGVKPYDGPAALIGLDILAQRRVVLEAARDNTRRRRVFVSQK
jgi:hypothetical protein